MDTVSYACRTVAWVLSHIASAASPRSGQSTPASCETSIQQILVQLLVSQLELLEVILLRLLAVDLVPWTSLSQKNSACLQQVKLVRSADQPMGLIAANSTGLK
jgi:hypothetical protein